MVINLLNVFYPDKSYNGSQIEGKCQISLLLNHLAKTIQSPKMEQPQHLSVRPQVFLNFFPNWALSRPVPFHWVAIALASFSQPHHPPPQLLTPSIFWLGGNISVSFDWVGISQYLSAELHSVSRSCMSMPLMFHTHTFPSQYLSYWKGAGNLLHHQIKLRISTNIRQPGKTYPNSSTLPEEVDGCKRPLLVPKLRFLVKSRLRKEVHSGSLHRSP